MLHPGFDKPTFKVPQHDYATYKHSGSHNLWLRKLPLFFAGAISTSVLLNNNVWQKQVHCHKNASLSPVSLIQFALFIDCFQLQFSCSMWNILNAIKV